MVLKPRPNPQYMHHQPSKDRGPIRTTDLENHYTRSLKQYTTGGSIVISTNCLNLAVPKALESLHYQHPAELTTPQFANLIGGVENWWVLPWLCSVPVAVNPHQLPATICFMLNTKECVNNPQYCSAHT